MELDSGKKSEKDEKISLISSVCNHKHLNAVFSHFTFGVNRVCIANQYMINHESILLDGVTWHDVMRHDAKFQLKVGKSFFHNFYQGRQKCSVLSYHSLDKCIKQGFFHKQSASSDAVLPLVEEH